MNDQQLVAALRGLDRSVEPEPTFADALYDTLRRQAFPVARQPMQRNVLLVAALLAAAALGLALAVGSQLFDNRPLTADPTTQPSSTPSYVVEIPPGIVPASAPESVATVVRSIEGGRFGLTAPVERIDRLSWQPADAEFPTVDGGAISSAEAYWAVTAETVDGTMIFLLSDATLEIVGTDGPRGEPSPEPTLTVLPTLDPAIGIQLVGSGGARIEPVLLQLPGAADRPGFGRIVPMDGLLWVLANPVSMDGPAYLVRTDTATNAAARVDVPDGSAFGTLVAGVNRLWLSAEGELLALDPTSGAVLDRFPVEGSVTGETPEGLWLRTVSNTEPAVGGGILVDPSTGRELRRIESPERGQPYVGLWQPPAFGSLWDVDRNTGLVHRIDPATDQTISTIDLGVGLASTCGSDFGLVPDVPGLGGVVGGLCGPGLVLIDPATDAVVGTLPGSGVPIDGGWWSLRTPEPNGQGWDNAGELVRTDPSGTEPELTLALSLERYGGRSMALADDALWLLVAERGDENQDYEHNAALLRIPVGDLPS